MEQARAAILCAFFCSLWGCAGGSESAAAQSQTPKNLFPVKPVVSGPAPAASSLRIGNGQYFSYALPQGWRVGEDGQFALTLAAPDNKAITVMVGNAGLPINYPPGRFVYEKLSALRPENLQVSQPRPATPIAGFAQAYQFEVTYAIRGVPCRGAVKCHIAPAYDTQTMAMTAALSESSQWPGYATWLPQVAEQISATNGGAFGMRGIMAQNLQNSTAYAEAARQYREWSQKNWQQVTDDRNASQDRQNFYRRENLGGVQTYTNPFGGAAPQVQLPMTYKHYWIDNQGNVLGSNDPGANPNTGSTIEWKQMPRYQP
jgi:hypothetical protein